MAVVQISKIQVRRGQKNSNSGVPQLSSAEFAWAVDSQELFIGNGSVAEGAPYVGNTKILTEHDNILSLASSYEFASTDTSIFLSEPRSLQDKLDEYVSVADFGAVGDGSTDCVAAFETAFSQLFRNTNSNYKKVLLVPNGEYLLVNDLRIPSGVIIKGETQLGAVLNIGNRNIRFVTSTGSEIADFDSSNRPTNINISNITIQRTSGQLVLSGIASSVFEHIKFKGEYELTNANVTLLTEPAAVLWNNDLAGIKVTDIKFNSCLFEANSVGAKCVQTDSFDTTIQFNDCKFFIADTAVYISGVSNQGNNWQITNCDFEEVTNQAFRSSNGHGTFIQRCRFKNCGNGTGTSATPTDPIVYFGQKNNNLVLDCSSDRQQAAGIVTSDNASAVIEVFNADKATFIDRNYAVISLSDSFRPLAVFSAYTRYIRINYFLSLGVFSRFGVLTMTVGDGLQQVAITDEYQYSPSLTTSEGGPIMTNFEFSATIRDNDNLGDSSLAMDTVVLSYKNPLPGATGTISFDVAYGV